MGVNKLPSGCHLTVKWPGVKPAVAKSDVRCPYFTTMLSSHSDIKVQASAFYWSIRLLIKNPCL